MDKEVLDEGRDLSIKAWACGPLDVNCYLVYSLACKDAILIDPGWAKKEICHFIEEQGLKLKLVIATHGHLDHILGVPEILNKWDVKVACHKEDITLFMNPDPFLSALFYGSYKPFRPEKHLEDGDKIYIGPNTLEVIHTPGHTPGSICLLAKGLLFSGDTLFQAGIGRTDLLGGDYDTLIHSIKTRLWPLSDKLVLLPGHGNPSTIGEEKKRGFF